MSEDDTIFSRWSRRKQRVSKEEQKQEHAEPDVDAAKLEPTVETEEDEAAVLEKLGLPVPESLKEGDDFSGFMKAGVPEFLRKRALRVLWRSNPVLANLDGLNDYDDDFRSPELTQKVLATAYKVGRGILSDKSEIEPPVDVIEDVSEPPSEPDILSMDSDPVSETSHLPQESEIAASSRDAPPDEDTAPPRPRRMHFDT